MKVITSQIYDFNFGKWYKDHQAKGVFKFNKEGFLNRLEETAKNLLAEGIIQTQDLTYNVKTISQLIGQGGGVFMVRNFNE
jgi:hypothetical protein